MSRGRVQVSTVLSEPTVRLLRLSASSAGADMNCRLQRREYAPIDIVLTEKKGYGVRASASIARRVCSTSQSCQLCKSNV